MIVCFGALYCAKCWLCLVRGCCVVKGVRLFVELGFACGFLGFVAWLF